MAAVKARLVNDPQVVGVRFLSRSEALEQLRKKYPALTANLTSNPLPNSFRVKRKSGVLEESFVPRYRALKLRAVESVKSITATRVSCVTY